MVKSIHSDVFYNDGRGPTLVRVHRGINNVNTVAIDYRNPDEEKLRHLKFYGLQVEMITPEEVIGYKQLGDSLSKHHPASILDLGKSIWLKTFTDLHLEKCSHYQILFYDELFDVICEGIQAIEGGFEP